MELKSQICTTKEQSERLLKLGLKNETADMSWFRRSTNVDFECCTSSYTEWVEEILPIVDDYTLKDIIPAWSLHRLLCLYGLDYTIKEVYNNAEECYGMLICAIEIAIEDEYFNKDYLEEKK